MVPGLPWLIMYRFPIEFSSNLIPNAPLGCLSSSCIGFLFNAYSKLMPNAPWAALAPLVLVSYSILIQNWCQMVPLEALAKRCCGAEPWCGWRSVTPIGYSTDSWCSTNIFRVFGQHALAVRTTLAESSDNMRPKQTKK